MNALNAFAIVEHVQPTVLTSGAHSMPTPDVSPMQRYLNSAPEGTLLENTGTTAIAD